MKLKIDNIPDIFDAGLTHVVLNSEPAGTIRKEESGLIAALPDGSRSQHVSDYDQAIYFLRHGTMPKAPKPKQVDNQMSLF